MPAACHGLSSLHSQDFPLPYIQKSANGLTLEVPHTQDMDLHNNEKRLSEARVLLEGVTAELASILGGQAASSASAGASELTKYEYFKLFREYRLAEQHLINCRLTWFLTLQGFLFTAYGLLVQKLGDFNSAYKVTQSLPSAATHMASLPPEFFDNPLVFQVRVALTAIPLAGLFISLAVFMGVAAAVMSLKGLSDAWKENVEKKFTTPWLPEIAGGGSKLATPFGKWFAFLIPLGMLLAWAEVAIKLWQGGLCVRLW
jgi:hypothetical protein